MCSNANAKHWHHHRKITIPLYDTIQRLIVRESEQNRKETYRKRKQMLTVIPWRGKIVYEKIGCPRIRNVHTHIYTKQMWTKLSGVVKRIAWRKKLHNIQLYFRFIVSTHKIAWSNSCQFNLEDNVGEYFVLLLWDQTGKRRKNPFQQKLVGSVYMRIENETENRNRHGVLWKHTRQIVRWHHFWERPSICFMVWEHLHIALFAPKNTHTHK